MAIQVVYEMPVGNMVEKCLLIDGPNPYTVGGQPYTANELFMGRIQEVRVSGLSAESTSLPSRLASAYLQPNRGIGYQGSDTVYVAICTTIAGGTDESAIDLSAYQFYMWVRGWNN